MSMHGRQLDKQKIQNKAYTDIHERIRRFKRETVDNTDVQDVEDVLILGMDLRDIAVNSGLSRAHVIEHAIKCVDAVDNTIGY